MVGMAIGAGAMNGKARPGVAVLALAALVLLLPSAAAAANWTTARLPGSAGKVFLMGASCPSTSLCVVSGTNNLIATSTDPTGGSGAWDYRYVGDGPWPKTEEWPTEGISGKPIRAVSCPTVSLCVGVTEQGNIYSSTNPTGPSSAWNWTQVDDGKGRNTHLFGVSCPTASFCVAVSGRRDDPGHIFTSTEPTGGAQAWHSITLAEPFEFRAVSCPTASLCVAVGADGRVVVSTEPTGDSSAWRIVGAPGGSGTVQGVFCLTVLCISGNEGGNLLTTTSPAGPLGSWDSFPGGGSVQITGGSCASPSLCIAVDNNGSVLRSENPTGGHSAWQYENVVPFAPPPPGETLEGNALFAASCPSPRLCVAAGSQGRIIVSSDPFAEIEPTAGGRGNGKRKRGPKRPRTKIATVNMPTGRQLVHHKGKLMIRFHSVGRAYGFLCSLDGKAFRHCHSPKRYVVARTGKHAFKVRAIGSTGLKGPIARELIDIPPLCTPKPKPGICTDPGGPNSPFPHRQS
jgi:hypothetical protein